MSKIATAEYLKSHFDEDVNLSKIHRYLDKLYNTQQESVQKICVGHAFSILGGRVEMLFYDVHHSISKAFVKAIISPILYSTGRNIGMLKSGGYKFIVGSRKKKSDADIERWLLLLPHEDGLYREPILDNGDRLILS